MGQRVRLDPVLMSLVRLKNIGLNSTWWELIRVQVTIDDRAQHEFLILRVDGCDNLGGRLSL